MPLERGQFWFTVVERVDCGKDIKTTSANRNSLARIQ